MIHNQVRCSTCGRISNQREVTLYTGMVKDLARVYQWCMQNRKYEFTRKEIKHLFLSENSSARWGDWILFGRGMIYKPKGKGSWGMNLERTEFFLKNQYPIYGRVVIAPITREKHYYDKKFISEIPELKDLLDEDGSYKINYISDNAILTYPLV